MPTLKKAIKTATSKPKSRLEVLARKKAVKTENDTTVQRNKKAINDKKYSTAKRVKSKIPLIDRRIGKAKRK